MTMPLWFYNLAVYCAQLAILIATGGLMVAATRLREPQLRLIYWQVLFGLGLLLPAIEPWQSAQQIDQGIARPGESVAHAGTAGIKAAAALPAQAVPAFSIYEIIALALVAGLLFRLLWLAAGLVRLRRSRLHARPLGPHAAVERFQAALSVSPAVLVTDRISSPVTFGWRAPKVLLPRKFLQMDEARQSAILCHELLHVRRRDWLWHLAEEVLRSLFWFHLAVAWLIAQIRLCREQIVDREVVIIAGSRRDYLDALFEIASSSCTSSHAPAPLFLSERHLKRRVTLILKEATMSRKNLIFALSASLGGLLLTCALVAGTLPLKTSVDQTSATVSLQTPLVRSDTHFYGNPDATVTVVEFGDFECPACRKAESVAEEVRKNLGSRVRFTYRQFPLTKFHHQAEKAAEAAECAAEQGKFWQAVNYLSDHPLDFSAHGIQQFAAGLGLDPARTSQCLSSGRMAARVQEDVRDGRALGVHSVPTFFVGSNKIVGIPSYSQLNKLIEQELHASSDAQPAPPKGAKIYKVGGNVQAPKPVYHVEPPYTPQARKAHLSGTVVLSCVIDAKGNVVEVKEGSKLLGQGLDESAINTVRTWKFKPGMREGVPVPVKVMVEVSFRYFENKKSDPVSQNSDSATDPPAQAEQGKTANGAEPVPVVPKIDQAKIQQQVEEAMKQLKKMNTPEMRQQLTQAMEQAKITQQAAAQVNKAELQRQLDDARKQIEQAMQEARAARKEAEEARQDAMRARREADAQRNTAKSAPSPEPKPAPPSPKAVVPPPPPPAPPAPPQSQ